MIERNLQSLNEVIVGSASPATALGLKPRQGQRIIAALKTKANLKRRGADKNGEVWYNTARMAKGK